MLLPRYRDRLEARVNTERAENSADMVANRFETEMQLARDLLRRAPMLQQA
jgi:hypothetical protein